MLQHLTWYSTLTQHFYASPQMALILLEGRFALLSNKVGKTKKNYHMYNKNSPIF